MNQKTVLKKLLVGLFSLMLALGVSACSDNDPSTPVVDPPVEEGDTRPNILLIVADDLGYSDLGAYGGEISTPVLDDLAGSGVMMTNFHVAPTCSVTRSMLMSGTDSHLAGVGMMIEARDDGSPEMQASENYQGYLKTDLDAFPAKLNDAGYHTYMAGKWHLANLPAGPPAWATTCAAARGFEKSFILLPGGASFFSNMMGIHPMGQHAVYMEDYDIVQELPADFYSTKNYTDKLIEYIDSNQGDDKPFFAYAAYTAPHWPLQVPDEWLDRYKGVYDDGYDALREERVARMKELGIIDPGMEVNPGVPENPAWADLTEEEKATQIRAMEIYAAMVEYMDEQIGRLVDHLKEIGEYDNTLIVFMSDNGAEVADPHIFWPPYIPGVTSDAIDSFTAQLDESYENMGKAGSYVSYGQGWGQVSCLPHRFFKGTTAEGGIRAPMFVKYPEMAGGGTISDSFCTVMDLAPTFLEIAGADLPVQTLEGDSMVSFLEGAESAVHGPDYGVGWEFMGGQAYIQNDYKIFMNMPANFAMPEDSSASGGDGVTWELYDLVNDQAELNDLAGDATYFRLFLDLQESYEEYATENGVVKFGPEDVP